jgi:hypothetical protein
VVWGDVHDGNAFALGGISGHAGLFAAAAAARTLPRSKIV